MNTPIMTLTTDFGTQDGFVGQMKGVILSINPVCAIVDITHDITAFSVREAALVIKGVSRYFPPNTIHLAVVDPGVGSMRKNIVVKAQRSLFVGPDNGLFSWILSSDASWETREIADPTMFLPNPHPTFHGRDVYAPAAAYLSMGKDFETVGPPLDDPVMLPCPAPQETSDGLLGEIIYIDRFGNGTTNIEGSMLMHRIRDVQCADTRISGLDRCFADVPVGMPLALVNSFGLLEIAVNGGNAAHELGIRVGDYVNIRWDWMN